MGLWQHSSAYSNQKTDAATGDQTRLHHATKLSLKVTGPLLVAGVVSAVAVASTGSNTTSSQSSTADTTKDAATNTSQAQVDTSTQATPVTDQTTTSTSATVTNNGGVSTSVTVNGQPVDVPANGSVQKTITSPDGSTTVNISASNQGSTSNTSFTSSYLNISTNSSSNGGGSTFNSTQFTSNP